MMGRAATLAAVMLAGMAAPSHAQEAERGGNVGLTATLHAGGTVFTPFQDITLEALGAPQSSYAGTIAASASATLAADVTVWFQPWLGGRIRFGYSPASFEVRLADEDREEVLGSDADYQQLRYSDLSVFTVGMAAMLTLPIPSTHIAPYAIGGLGAALFWADDRDSQGLETAFGGNEAALRPMAVVGLGVKIPLEAARIALSFELTDQILFTPIDANTDRTLLDTGALRVVSRAHPSVVDGGRSFTHAVGVAAGLSFTMGRRTPSDHHVRP